MATSVLPPAANRSLTEDEIDELVTRSTSACELINSLVDVAVTSVGTNLVAGHVERHFWPWNRASDTLFKKQRADDAVEVCCAMYLVFLMLQTHFQIRLHKAMP